MFVVRTPLRMLSAGLVAMLALAIAGHAEEPDFHTRFALVQPDGAALDRLEGQVEARSGRLYGGLRGRGDQVFGDTTRAEVYAGFLQRPADGKLDLRYNHRMGMFGRDSLGRFSVDMDRRVALGLRLGTRLQMDDDLDNGSAIARAEYSFGPETILSARLEQPIRLDGDGGGDTRSEVKLVRRLDRRRAELGLEMQEATPPRAELLFRVSF